MRTQTASIAILAAGLGTRMRSKRAKVLHRAGGKALVEHAVDAALALAAPERVAVVVGHQAERVRELLAGRGVRFVLQSEQKGTGHAVACCREALGGAEGPLLVTVGDCPLLRAETLSGLIESHAKSGAACTVITTEVPEPAGYGRIVRDRKGDVAAIVEEKAATAEEKRIREINSGLYCFDAALLWKHIGSLEPNPASGELYLTDLIGLLNAHGCRVAAYRIEDSSELLGINTRIELADADRILRGRKVRELMLAGVTIEKPETVTIDVDVRVGQDTVIEPFAQILGAAVIGEDCRIGASSILRNATLGDGVEVEAFSWIADSRIDSGARIGPYARLRMNAHVREKGVIGNFVELKKTDFGRGAKAQHLAYLGDSQVGEGSNIGAGTITCNYDGVKKHETRIGAQAFVGSNSTLVAPVEIGEGSYVGAGSVITENVESGALALGRSRQVNKPEWANKRRAEKLPKSAV